MSSAPTAPSLAIGIDLGATKIAAALVNEEGVVLADKQAPTDPDAGQQAVLERIAWLAGEMIIAAAGREVIGIGIGSPGEVDPVAGIVRNAVNLGWREVELVSEIRSRLSQPLPVKVLIDSHASVLGEYLFGAAQGCQDFVYVGIGSGLGGGIMSQGRLLTGANQAAGMIGHLCLDPDGLECACGNRGCAETVVSGPGLVRLVHKLRKDSAALTGLGFDGRLDAEAVVRAARQGDSLAQAAVLEMGQRLGIVFSICAALLNPARIVIGGGLGTAAFDLLTAPARQELDRRTIAANHNQLVLAVSNLKSPSMGAAAALWYDRRFQI